MHNSRLKSDFSLFTMILESIALRRVLRELQNLITKGNNIADKRLFSANPTNPHGARGQVEVLVLFSSLGKDGCFLRRLALRSPGI